MAAGLNDANADTLAAAICTALGIVDTESIDQMKAQWRVIYAHLKTDIAITVTVASVTGVTAGGAVSGPGTGTGVPQ